MPQPQYGKRIDDLQLETSGRIVLFCALTRKQPPTTFCSAAAFNQARADGLVVVHHDNTIGLRPNGRKLLGSLLTIVNAAAVKEMTKTW